MTSPPERYPVLILGTGQAGLAGAFGLAHSAEQPATPDYPLQTQFKAHTAESPWWKRSWRRAWHAYTVAMVMSEPIAHDCYRMYLNELAADEP
jgi:cation diffusion facilitator CzcD-associated flavoprotein CzcO